MKPNLEELKPFSEDRKAAAKHFRVSEKTITRWMQSYGLYHPKPNYGSKLDMDKAREIRQRFDKGDEIKQIAEEYGVTFSTVSRIIQNISYKEVRETAHVSVQYNPY